MSMLRADLIPVRHIQGTTHGFLKVETLEGRTLALGELVQTVHGGLVTSRLTFRFKDGSLDDETTVYTEHGSFRLVSDHHIQRGAFFSNGMDLIVKANGDVSVTTVDKDGKTTHTDTHMDLPPDISNGLPLTLVQNLTQMSPETKVSMVLGLKSPALAKVSFKADGTDNFLVGGAPRRAQKFTADLELGGMKAVIAPLIGKKPKQYRIWFLGGSAPMFLRVEGQLAMDGPVVRVEQISPSFPANEARRTDDSDPPPNK